MLLAGPTATLKGKLTEKVRYRPTAAIEPLLPAGTDTLESLPVVRPGVSLKDLVRSEPTAEEMAEYSVAIKRTAAVLARNHMKQGTLAEHDTYTVWVATYMQLSGFGTFVIVDETVRGDGVEWMASHASEHEHCTMGRKLTCLCLQRACVCNRRRLLGSVGS